MSIGVVIFHTTTSAIRAEKMLKRLGLVVKLVPTPRELSSDCGISLRFLAADETAIRQNLDTANIEYEIFILEEK